MVSSVAAEMAENLVVLPADAMVFSLDAMTAVVTVCRSAVQLAAVSVGMLD